jgi:hypothetical protein
VSEHQQQEVRPLDLSKFKETVTPAVHEVLRSGIGLPAAAEAFFVKAVDVALAESGGNGMVAARKLGVKNNFVYDIQRGVRRIRFSGPREPKQK